VKIIILGAGQVGASVAESLVSEANDITIVDTDASAAGAAAGPARSAHRHRQRLQSLGAAQAGAEDADLLIAVTQSDQTNLCACKTAHALFNLPTRIARVRSTDYADYPELLRREELRGRFLHLPRADRHRLHRQADRVPRGPAGAGVRRRPGQPGGGAGLRGRPAGRPPAQGHPQAHPQVDARIAAIFRRDTPVTPEGDTVIEAGDEVFCLAATKDIRRVMRELRRMDKAVKRIMIAGGGNIGHRVVRAIEGDYQVKVIDRNKRHAEWLAENVRNALVLQGDATDEKLLERRTSTRWTCSSRSPTTTRTTSWRRCWPSGWAPSGSRR
jgi:trk system potassium uptake protein TrkA